jgi:hypothetical protein
MRPRSFASPARTARTTRTKRKRRRNEADLPVTGGGQAGLTPLNFRCVITLFPYPVWLKLANFLQLARSTSLGYLLLLVMGTGRGKGKGPHSKGEDDGSTTRGKGSISEGKRKGHHNEGRGKSSNSKNSWCGSRRSSGPCVWQDGFPQDEGPPTSSTTRQPAPPPPPPCREMRWLGNRQVAYPEMCSIVNAQEAMQNNSWFCGSQLEEQWKMLEPSSRAVISMSEGAQACGMDNQAPLPKESTALRLAILSRWPSPVTRLSGQVGHDVDDVRSSVDFQKYCEVAISMWQKEVQELVSDGYMVCTCCQGPDSEEPLIGHGPWRQHDIKDKHGPPRYALLKNLLNEHRRNFFLNRIAPCSDTSRARQRRRLAWSCFRSFQMNGNGQPRSCLTIDEMKSAMIALDFVMTWDELRAAVDEVSPYEGQISFSTFETMISEIEPISDCKLQDVLRKKQCDIIKLSDFDARQGAFWSYDVEKRVLVIEGGENLPREGSKRYSAAVAVKIPETSWLADARLVGARVNLENTLTKMKPFEEWHQQDMGSHYNRLLDVETAQMMMHIFCMDDVFDSRRQSGTTAIGGTSTWLELRADLELQLRLLRDVGGDVLDELLKQQQSPLCPKRSTAQQLRKTVITAVFHHLFKWNVVACEQGHGTNACRHYAIFAVQRMLSTPTNQ